MRTEDHPDIREDQPSGIEDDVRPRLYLRDRKTGERVPVQDSKPIPWKRIWKVAAGVIAGIAVLAVIGYLTRPASDLEACSVATNYTSVHTFSSGETRLSLELSDGTTRLRDAVGDDNFEDKRLESLATEYLEAHYGYNRALFEADDLRESFEAYIPVREAAIRQDEAARQMLAYCRDVTLPASS